MVWVAGVLSPHRCSFALRYVTRCTRTLWLRLRCTLHVGLVTHLHVVLGRWCQFLVFGCGRSVVSYTHVAHTRTPTRYVAVARCHARVAHAHAPLRYTVLRRHSWVAHAPHVGRTTDGYVRCVAHVTLHYCVVYVDVALIVYVAFTFISVDIRLPLHVTLHPHVAHTALHVELHSVVDRSVGLRLCIAITHTPVQSVVDPHIYTRFTRARRTLRSSHCTCCAPAVDLLWDLVPAHTLHAFVGPHFSLHLRSRCYS